MIITFHVLLLKSLNPLDIMIYYAADLLKLEIWLTVCFIFKRLI